MSELKRTEDGNLQLTLESPVRLAFYRPVTLKNLGPRINVIYGSSGSGKSWVLDRLMEFCAKPDVVSTRAKIDDSFMLKQLKSLGPVISERIERLDGLQERGSQSCMVVYKQGRIGEQLTRGTNLQQSVGLWQSEASVKISILDWSEQFFGGNRDYMPMIFALRSVPDLDYQAIQRYCHWIHDVAYELQVPIFIVTNNIGYLKTLKGLSGVSFFNLDNAEVHEGKAGVSVDANTLGYSTGNNKLIGE